MRKTRSDILLGVMTILAISCKTNYLYKIGFELHIKALLLVPMKEYETVWALVRKICFLLPLHSSAEVYGFKYEDDIIKMYCLLA